MILTFEEKQLLAVVSKPDPVKSVILARLEEMQTSDFKSAKLIQTLHDKLAEADEQTVFIAIVAAQSEEVEVEEMMTDDDSALSRQSTEDLLAAVAGGDPAKYREDLRKYGYDGFLKSIDQLDYPEEAKAKIRELLDEIR